MILITGGCGYIGSHINKQLHSAGFDTVVLDNLSTGHADAARWGRFVRGDLCDADMVAAVLKEWPIEAVLHFAAFSLVEESVRDPQKYYRNNIGGTLNLLEAMLAAGVYKMVFSSSGAVYGLPSETPIPETHATAPLNPYGYTKNIIERVLRDYQQAYGMNSVALRYFNAAGADNDGELCERHDPETHLIPSLLKGLKAGRAVTIYGEDYPTPDGTCVRDYIHVKDLAHAHVLALQKLLAGPCADAYNLSTGHGCSVRDVVGTVEEVTGQRLEVVAAERRAGDPPVLVGDPAKAKRELGWQTRYSLLEMIGDQWSAMGGLKG
ncbi:MAG: UDP-glucose 4-epimerase GalE [Peptococcaceae bacterium]|nr:UDP-glucose 4-epimerase GalE [Peptococcaceae bacterium]